ncbi:MAG: hypothetical protein WBM98_16290 [Maribacter sp.]
MKNGDLVQWLVLMFLVFLIWTAWDDAIVVHKLNVFYTKDP